MRKRGHGSPSPRPIPPSQHRFNSKSFSRHPLSALVRGSDCMSLSLIIHENIAEKTDPPSPSSRSSSDSPFFALSLFSVCLWCHSYASACVPYATPQHSAAPSWWHMRQVTVSLLLRPYRAGQPVAKCVASSPSSPRLNPPPTCFMPLVRFLLQEIAHHGDHPLLRPPPQSTLSPLMVIIFPSSRNSRIVWRPWPWSANRG